MIVHLAKNVRPATDKRFMIFGQRNSGTNYLQVLVSQNYRKKFSWPIVWKHWVGFTDPGYSEENVHNTLAIGIVRDPIDWLASMRVAPPHAPHMNNMEWVKFLQVEWRSRHDCLANGKAEFDYEIMEDRDFDTGKRYANILKMRSKKLGWLLDPPIPCPYILIRYEDLKADMPAVMRLIGSTFGLDVPVSFVNVANDARAWKPGKYKPRAYPRPTPEAMDIIRNQLDWELESRIGYSINK